MGRPDRLTDCFPLGFPRVFIVKQLKQAIPKYPNIQIKLITRLQFCLVRLRPEHGPRACDAHRASVLVWCPWWGSSQTMEGSHPFSGSGFLGGGLAPPMFAGMPAPKGGARPTFDSSSEIGKDCPSICCLFVLLCLDLLQTSARSKIYKSNFTLSSIISSTC